MKEYEIWDLKKAIAEFIVPRLKEFRGWVINDKMMGIPTWVRKEFSNVEMTDFELKQAWINILDEMIKGFEHYAGENTNEDLESMVKQKGRALELFHRYYDHLWD